MSDGLISTCSILNMSILLLHCHPCPHSCNFQSWLMQFPFLLTKHLLVLLWWKHIQQFQSGWLHFTTTNTALHSIRPLETTNKNSDTYWCVFSGEVGGLGFCTWACICKPHRVNVWVLTVQGAAEVLQQQAPWVLCGTETWPGVPPSDSAGWPAAVCRNTGLKKYELMKWSWYTWWCIFLFIFC